MTNNFKLIRFTLADFILLSVGLLMFLSAACSTRSTQKNPAESPEIQRAQIQSEGFVRSVAFSPDGKTLAGGSFKIVKLWDVASGKELQSLPNSVTLFEVIAFSPDGKTLDSSDVAKTVKMWDVASGKELNKP